MVEFINLKNNIDIGNCTSLFITKTCDHCAIGDYSFRMKTDTNNISIVVSKNKLEICRVLYLYDTYDSIIKPQIEKLINSFGKSSFPKPAGFTSGPRNFQRGRF